MKSYTDLEQSKRLAEFLPLKSADMGWNIFVDGTTRILPIDDWDLVKDGSGNVKFHPAWSLVALLGVMPKEIVYNKGNIVFLEFRIWDTFLEYANDGGYTLYATESYDNLVDAAFEMVYLLKEQNEL